MESIADAPRTAILKCPLCGNDMYAVVAHADRYGFPGRWNYCLGCSFVWLADLPAEDAYAKFYNGEYRELTARFGRKGDIEENQRRYGRDLAKTIVPHSMGRARILDVGGGSGIVASEVMKTAMSRGASAPTVHIIEPNVEDAKRAAMLGFSVVPKPTLDTYDMILVCRTIDHVTDPAALLRSLAAVCHPQTILYVDHVDFESVIEKSLEGGLHVDHPSNFLVETFLGFVAARGFEVKYMYFPRESSCIGYVLAYTGARPLRPVRRTSVLRRIVHP
uniref:Putative methyltransferase n=1 Tax=viral metagenome TaxID=1070528 RepID=A0A6M3XKH3_9ZZZZ